MKPSLIIVGLGNPGANHEATRHNAGFWAIDQLSNEYGEGDWEEKQKFISHIQEARILTIPVLLVKPQTYMNRSGEAIQKLVSYFKLDPSEQLLVLTDDIDLPLAELRLKKKGGPGTHNGLKSIVDIYGEDFPRLRIGLGDKPSGADLAAWVLSKPPKEDRTELDEVIATIPSAVKEYVMEALEE